MLHSRFIPYSPNLDALTVLEGLSKRNWTLTLDAEDEHFLSNTVAHSRVCTLIPNPTPTKIYKGKDSSVNGLKSAVDQGAILGSHKFYQHSSFEGNTELVDQSDAGMYKQELGESDDDDEDGWLDIDIPDLEDPDLMEFTGRQKYHLLTWNLLWQNSVTMVEHKWQDKHDTEDSRLSAPKD